MSQAVLQFRTSEKSPSRRTTEKSARGTSVPRRARRSTSLLTLIRASQAGSPQSLAAPFGQLVWAGTAR